MYQVDPYDLGYCHGFKGKPYSPEKLNNYYLGGYLPGRYKFGFEDGTDAKNNAQYRPRTHESMIRVED